jgi:hypothetical protein
MGAGHAEVRGRGQGQGTREGGIVFIGSSSIRRWTNLAESFPDQKVVNRGFGGSEMEHAAQYASRVVVPHAPRIVVLYSGENDLNRGVAPQTVFASYKKFYDTVHGALPDTRVVAVSLAVARTMEDPQRDARRSTR